MKYYFTIIRKELMEVFRDKNSFFMSLILVLIMPTIIIEYGIQFGTQDGKILITERAKEIAFIIEQVDVPYEIIEVQDVIKEISEKKDCVEIDYMNDQYIIMYYEFEPTIEIVQDINRLLEFQIVNTDSKINGKQIIYEPILEESTEDMNELAVIVPLLLILSIMTGTGNSVAINTFTGEKERGSFEALLLTQVKRSTLFFAKLTTVALNMMLSALVYVVAILAAIWFINTQNGSVIKEIETWNIVILILSLCVFSLFIASYISIIALKAHNVKEAQLSMMFFAFFTCGIGAVLNSALAQTNEYIVLTIPVVNIIRILENLFKGTVEIEIVIMTNIVNIVLTWLGIKIGKYIINTNKM